jgi:hypothetical protein
VRWFFDSFQISRTIKSYTGPLMLPFDWAVNSPFCVFWHIRSLQDDCPFFRNFFLAFCLHIRDAHVHCDTSSFCRDIYATYLSCEKPKPAPNRFVWGQLLRGGCLGGETPKRISLSPTASIGVYYVGVERLSLGCA